MSGIHTEVLENLADKTEDLKAKYVVLAFDEMKIKQDLVYDKHKGHIIGYVNLGNTEQQLRNLEQGTQANTPATHVLQFMVRAITGNLNYPICHYATDSITGEQLMGIVWGVIEAVESAGLKVVIVTADGDSQNRKFFRLHPANHSNIQNGIMYKTPNLFAPERNVYFMSDVPHLMKTTRNCWEKSGLGSSRLMTVR